MNVQLAGRVCELVEIYDERNLFPYRVRFDDGTESVAVDCSLAPILADGSVGEPLSPPAHSRKGWDGYLKMLEHSANKWFAHPDGNIWPSVIAPTREEVIRSTTATTRVVCGPHGEEGKPYKPGREEAERLVGDYCIEELEQSETIEQSEPIELKRSA